jgi:hypothetical protein
MRVLLLGGALKSPEMWLSYRRFVTETGRAIVPARHDEDLRGRATPALLAVAANDRATSIGCGAGRAPI